MRISSYHEFEYRRNVMRLHQFLLNDLIILIVHLYNCVNYRDKLFKLTFIYYLSFYVYILPTKYFRITLNYILITKIIRLYNRV